MKKIKWIDERGFLFGKISVVDILAVLLVAALGFMLYVRFFSGEETGGRVAGTEKTRIEYTLKVTGAKHWHIDALKPGDIVYNGDAGALLGTVKEVRAEPSNTLMNLLDGTVVSVPQEDTYVLYITLESEATSSAGWYYVGGAIELNLNLTLQLTTIYDTVTGTVVSIG